ncbi:hypothetical protein ABZS71_16500 [Streptomyces sp. NPDC005393]|uniref:hypothetical protein n=1 Tax=Streptomyces sp. NPDC005393 TaxID=3157041 RepID=UPI0033B46FF2
MTDGACIVCDESKPRATKPSAPKASAPKASAPKASTPKASTPKGGTGTSRPGGSGAKGGGASKASGGAKPSKGTASGAARRPVSRPTGDWTCLKCDTRNAATSLSCLVCDTAWKAATKPKPAKPPTASKTAKTAKTASKTAKTATSPGSAKGTGASAPYRPTRPGTTRGTPSGGSSSAPRSSPPRREPADVFYPPPGGGGSVGYTPGGSPSPPPPTSSTPPRGTTSTPPRTTPSSDGKSCLKGCLGFLLLAFVFQALLNGCDWADLSMGSSGDPEPSSSAGAAGSCPQRIASALPGGDGAELVEAFHTRNADSGNTKNIVLCRTTGGDLYYYGEYADGREQGISMPAQKTDDGYLAENAPYRYRIHGGVVTITRDGVRIGEETLVPEPSPS